MIPPLKGRRLVPLNPLARTSFADSVRGDNANSDKAHATAESALLPNGAGGGCETFMANCGSCAVASWYGLPPLDMGILAGYRFDSSPEYVATLNEAIAAWLRASLVQDGHVCTSLSRHAGVVRMAYSNPALLAASIPEAAFEAQRVAAMPTLLPPSCTAHEVVVGQPETNVWDALAAPGVVQGDFFVALHAVALPDEWLRHRIAFLQASTNVAGSYFATVSRGDTTHSLANPSASEAQRHVESERDRLVNAGMQVQLFLVASAERERDLRTMDALLLGSMATVDGAGHLAPQRFSTRTVAIEDGMPLVRAHPEPEPLVRVVPADSAAAAAQPPTRAVEGLSVTNAEVRTVSYRAFATTGKPGAGEIVLGSYEQGGKARLPIERLAQHVLVTGVPGAGKTTFVSDLVAQLAANGIMVCVLEPAKVEYAKLLREMGSVRAGAPLPAFEVLGDDGRAAPLRLNPLQADAGIRVALHVQDLSTCLVSALGLEQQPLPLHIDQLLRRLYHEQGIDVQKPWDAAWPSVRELLAEVEGYVRDQLLSGPEVTANVRGALTLRARALCETPAFLTRTGLGSADVLARNRVIQLNDLGNQHSMLAGMLLLAKLVRFSRTLGVRRLHTVVVLEEAHVLLQSAEKAGSPFSQLYEQALAELRSSGIGFVTVEQRPSLLPAGVLANSVTKVAFSSLHGDDREAIGKAMGLSEYQSRRLGGLDFGQAIVSTMGSQGADLINTKAARRKE